MNQATQAASSNATQMLPVKRKRGRPRKDQCTSRINRMEVTRVPPGFEGMIGDQSHQANKVNNSNGSIVGQAVTGVIEAVFNEGYLLTVRIGNSYTNLRGVVFKPGKYVPVTADNDIAPHAQVIKRNEVNFPLENQTRGSNPSRERTKLNGASHVTQSQALMPDSANVVASRGRYTSSTAAPAAASPVGLRGAVVPVVLQHPILLNGSPANALPDESDSGDKDIVAAEPLAMLPPVWSSSPVQFSEGKSQQLVSQVQTSRQVFAGSLHENDPCNIGTQVVGEMEEAKNVKSPGLGEAVTGLNGSSDSSETLVDNSISSAEISNLELDRDISSIRAPYAPKPVNNSGAGRMTELLQALQENMDNQEPNSDSIVSGGES